MTQAELTPLLQALHRELAHALGAQFDRLLLFGSRARGEARPDSDVDVLVVVNGEVNYPDLLNRTSDIVAGLSLEHDVVISTIFVSKARWATGGSPFLINVRREAVAIWPFIPHDSPMFL